MQKVIKRSKKFHRAYKIAGTAAALVAVAYLLLLIFPQPLFAYSTKNESFNVYSSEPIPPEIKNVIDSTETRLRRSPFYDAEVGRDIYLTNSFKMYALLSHRAYNSFGNSVPLIRNVFINKNRRTQ